jgi:hypothetical protein
LTVSYYDWDLHLGFDLPLSMVGTGTLVTATGTITSFTRLSGGRVMVVISSDDQNTAYALLNADVVRMVSPALYRGNVLRVRGVVTRTSASLPAWIDAGGVQVEIA